MLIKKNLQCQIYFVPGAGWLECTLSCLIAAFLFEFYAPGAGALHLQHWNDLHIWRNRTNLSVTVFWQFFFGISILSKTTTKQSQFMHFYCKIFCQDLHTFPQMFQRRKTDSVNVFAYWMFDPLLLVPSSFHLA